MNLSRRKNYFDTLNNEANAYIKESNELKGINKKNYQV